VGLEVGDPGAGGEAGVAGGGGDDLGEMFDDGELFVWSSAPAFLRTWTRT
jgi:hypothetical protein